MFKTFKKREPKKVITYEEWLSYSEEERIKVYNSWNPYAGEGSDLLKMAIERFKEKYGKNAKIEIHGGVYHGGLLIIGVTINKGEKVTLPQKFEGFPVTKFYRSKNDNY